MRKTRWISTFVAISTFFVFMSCIKEPIDNYTTSPSEVMNLQIVNQDGAALLTWTDPDDENLFGIQITYYYEISNYRVLTTMESESILIAPKTQKAVITGLTNGTEYIFTVKTMDLNGNKSHGIIERITPRIIEKSPLQIILKPNTTEKTNNDITVSVNAITDSKSEIKKIGFKKGTFSNIDEILEESDISEKKSFIVEENASYTIAVTDTAGKRELSWITINNIDKIAPKNVTDLKINYDYGLKKATITWKDPLDSDFTQVEIIYAIGGNDSVTQTVEKGIQNYEIKNVETDTKIKVFVKAIDDVQNKSIAKTSEIVTTKSFSIRSISLNRNHVEYQSKKKITATIEGGNFEMLPTTEDDVLTIKVYDDKTLIQSCTTVAKVDIANNIATATFIAPDGTNNDIGKNYTVEATVNAEKTGVKTNLRVSSIPSIGNFKIYDTNDEEVSAISVNDMTTETTVKATIKAYNFDIADEIKLAFFDSNEKEVKETSKIVTKEEFSFKNSETYESFSVYVPIPQKEGIYTLKAIWDGNVISFYNYKTLQIYSAPIFTNFKIPTAGTQAYSNQLTTIFNGLNFKAPNVDSDSFKITCENKKTITTDSVVTIIDNATASVSLTIPNEAGIYTIVLSYGEKSITSDFIVKEYPSYSVGDVMLSDGTKIDYNEDRTFTDEEKTKAIAVFFGYNSSGIPLGIGLYNSSDSNKMNWASIGTLGYNTRFIPIECTSHWYETRSFSGDTDGKDNWEYICSVDPEGTVKSEVNYPAFDYILKYASTFNLPENYRDGWFIPSIAELSMLNRNKTLVNNILKALNGTTISLSDYYWSSSQFYIEGHSDSKNRTYILDFKEGAPYGGISSYPKNLNCYVCAVRAF